MAVQVKIQAMGCYSSDWGYGNGGGGDLFFSYIWLLIIQDDLSTIGLVRDSIWHRVQVYSRSNFGASYVQFVGLFGCFCALDSSSFRNRIRIIDKKSHSRIDDNQVRKVNNQLYNKFNVTSILSHLLDISKHFPSS